MRFHLATEEYIVSFKRFLQQKWSSQFNIITIEREYYKADVQCIDFVFLFRTHDILSYVESFNIRRNKN